jgi:hypothetical protein
MNLLHRTASSFGRSPVGANRFASPLNFDSSLFYKGHAKAGLMTPH